MFIQLLYNTTATLLLPFALLKLWWRGRKDPAYRHRWAERLAWCLPDFSKPVIWFHAVSVGETLAAKPLLEALLERYGDRYQLLITNGTVNGSRCTQKLFGDRVKHCYLPYDTAWLARRFVARVKPRLALLMETEVWPNVLTALYRRHIPVCLVNARLSAKSQHAYLRLASFFKPLFAGFACIAAQAPADAKRFVELGADPVETVGNLKFNLQIPADLKARASVWRATSLDQTIWLAASTHEGEEAVVLAAYQALRPQFPDLRLWLAPRHPERAEAVAKLVTSGGGAVQLRSQWDPKVALSPDTVVIIDTVGELLLFYASADLCFVGGSLGNRGGHNILEPAAVGTPSMTGSGMYNFSTIFQQFTAANAVLVVNDADDMVTAVSKLLSDGEYCAGLTQRASACFLAEQQALLNHMRLLERFLAND